MVEEAQNIEGDESEVIGLVTATDCFEAITGELDDPLDTEETTTDGSPRSGSPGSTTTLGGN